MKANADFLHETVTAAYRTRVLQSAQYEFRSVGESQGGGFTAWLGHALAHALVISAFAGLVFCGSNLVPGLKSEEIEKIAVATDPEILENIDWLEDFDILESAPYWDEESEI